MNETPLPKRKPTGFSEGVRHQLAMALEMKKQKKKTIVTSYKGRDWAKEALMVKAIFHHKLEKDDAKE
jgi:arginine decarboxylase-like protein